MDGGGTIARSAAAVWAPLRRQIGLLLIVLCALALGTFGVLGKVLGGGHPPLEVIVGVVAGALFVVVGLWSRARWPGNRTGLLLVLTGYGWLAEDLVTSDIAVAFTLGLLMRTASPALLLHLVLAFPTGQLETRAARRVAGLSYGVGFGMSATVLPFHPSDPLTCRCPENLLAVANNLGLAAGLWRVQDASFVVLLITTTVIVGHRWRNATPMQRRMMAPFLGAAVCYGAADLLYALYVLQRAELGFVHSQRPLEILNEIGRIALLALPVAFVIGLLRAEATRGTAASLLALLARRPSVGDLHAALVRTLDDPRLALGRWDDAAQGYVDHTGRALPLPAPGGPRTAAEVCSGDRRLAAFVHDSALCADAELIEAVSAAVRIALPEATPNDEASSRRLGGITIREREVLELIASGLGNRAIAAQLTLSERTVESHVNSIFRKLQLSDAERDNRRVLAALAFLGMAKPKDPC